MLARRSIAEIRLRAARRGTVIRFDDCVNISTGTPGRFLHSKAGRLAAAAHVSFFHALGAKPPKCRSSRRRGPIRPISHLAEANDEPNRLVQRTHECPRLVPTSRFSFRFTGSGRNRRCAGGGILRVWAPLRPIVRSITESAASFCGAAAARTLDRSWRRGLGFSSIQWEPDAGGSRIVCQLNGRPIDPLARSLILVASA